MRFWFYDKQKKVTGPYTCEELLKLPGFGPKSKIALESAQKSHAWRAAREFPEVRALLEGQSPADAPSQPPPTPDSEPTPHRRSAHDVGFLAYESGDYRTAVAYFSRALEVDSGDSEALFYRGMAGLRGLGVDWWDLLRNLPGSE